MPTKSYLYDGIKAIPMQNLPPEAWTFHGNPDDSALDELYSAVAFLNRAVAIRANDVSSLPCSISRNETDIWTSDEKIVPTEMEPFSDLVELIWRTEESLCLSSEAFWHKERNRVRVLNVRALPSAAAEPTVLRAHAGAVWSSAFSPSGEHIASASSDRSRSWQRP